jgi:FAD/FMN-containing dehydrogenase
MPRRPHASMGSGQRLPSERQHRTRTSSMTLATGYWRVLQRAIDGAVILPDSARYDEVRKPAMIRFDDIRPAGVVLCTTPEDVSATIAFARRNHLETAIRSGGHSVAGRSSTRGLLIDVTPMNAVSVERGVVAVGAGTRLGALEDVLLPHGLTVPVGSSRSVGVAGLTLGGGIGILGRTHGLTCDHLLRATVVLADGSVTEVDESANADLFWALRGAGGGTFGVVTSFVFRTVALPQTTVFHAAWPYEHASQLMRAWQAWAPDGPDELEATLRLSVGGEGDRPPVVDLFGAMLGTDADPEALIDGVSGDAGARPGAASFLRVPYPEAKRYLDGVTPPEVWRDGAMPNRPSRAGDLFTKSEFFRQTIPSEVISALSENFLRDVGSGESREVTFTPWGGAYNRVPADATAFVHRDARFIVQHLTSVVRDVDTSARTSARRWLARSWALVHPWGTGGVYPNFPDPELDDPGHAYFGDNDERLLRVKNKYDPDGIFRFR